MPVREVAKLQEGNPHVVDLIRSGKIGFVINSLTKETTDAGRLSNAAGGRRVQHSCLTSLDTAEGLLSAIRMMSQTGQTTVKALQDYLTEQ